MLPVGDAGQNQFLEVVCDLVEVLRFVWGMCYRIVIPLVSSERFLLKNLAVTWERVDEVSGLDLGHNWAILERCIVVANSVDGLVSGLAKPV